MMQIYNSTINLKNQVNYIIQIKYDAIKFLVKHLKILFQIGAFMLPKMEYLLHFLKFKSVRDISIPPNYIYFPISTRTGTIRSLNRPENAQYIRSLPTVL